MSLTDSWATHAIAVLTGLIPFAVYLLTSQKKILGYSVLTNAPIITINQADMVGRIVVSLDGKPVTGLRSVQIFLQNIGTKDIENQDVHLSFPVPVEIIGSQYQYDPPASSPHLEIIGKNQHSLTLGLMNPGDKVLVSFLTINNETGRYSVIAKGPNMKVKKFEPKLFVSPVINRTVTTACVLLAIGLFIAYFQSEYFLSFDLKNKIVAIFVVGILFIGGGTLMLREVVISIIKTILSARAKLEDWREQRFNVDRNFEP